MIEKRASGWIRAVAIVLAGSFLFAGCAETCRINTEPQGAKVYINGMHMGETPLVYRYRSGLPDTFIVEIEKPGYKRMANVTIDRTLRADASLALLLLAIVPYFFSARLEDQFVFPLEAEPGTVPETTTTTE